MQYSEYLCAAAAAAAKSLRGVVFRIIKHYFTVGLFV